MILSTSVEDMHIPRILTIRCDGIYTHKGCVFSESTCIKTIFTHMYDGLYLSSIREYYSDRDIREVQSHIDIIRANVTNMKRMQLGDAQNTARMHYPNGICW